MCKIALLIGAWNTLYWALATALRGYYAQALNLLRTPIEFWMAYWYLRSFPDDYKRFTHKSLTAPTYNEMLTKVEGKHKKSQDKAVRAWIKRLHEFSHVDRASVTRVMSPGKGEITYTLGPQNVEDQFHYCTSEAIQIIVMLLEGVDKLS